MSVSPSLVTDILESGREAGPLVTLPEVSNLEPWQPHKNSPLKLQSVEQPSCVQTLEKALIVTPTFTSKIFWVGCSTHPPGDLRLENGEVFRSMVVLDVLPGVGSSSDEQLSSV